MEEELQFDLYNKFYRNELYTELEDHIIELRKIFEIQRGGEYQKLQNIFPDVNTNKGLVAIELMRWLKPFVENPNFKLDCL